MANQLRAKYFAGPLDDDTEDHVNPSWADIETAIRSLDGNRSTLMTLGIGDPVPHMAIGGGQDGRYIVYATSDNMVFYNLINPEAASGKYKLKVGGQSANYDARMCIGLEEALKAGKTFAETGERDKDLHWEKQR